MDTELDTLKTVSKKIFHRAAEKTADFIGNIIADAFRQKKFVTNKNGSRKMIYQVANILLKKI